MGLFSRSLPKKPIITLPAAYSEDKAVTEITRKVLFMVSESKEEKDKLLDSVTSPLVSKFTINYAHALVNEFIKRFPQDIAVLGDENWHTIEATFYEGIYICTLIFYNNKQIRHEDIQVPTGKQFDEYFNKETKKFDKSADYADILIPPYLFKVIKDISLLILNELAKMEAFSKTSDEFQKSILMQYMHMSGAVLASYLMQDSFLAT